MATRLKRWLVERAVRDPRIRRIALNRIFAGYGADGTLCLVPFADHQVFVDPRDDRIAYSLLTGKAWQRAPLEAAFDALERAGRLAPGGVFVDVGANIGLMTIYALLSGRFARAVAIEPDPRNLELLQRNLELNNLAGRVDVVAMAASDHTGTMAFYRDTKNLGAHSLEPGFSMSPDDAGSEVEVRPLDAVLACRGIAAGGVGFVKIDVEGHEFAALAGMAGLIAARVPVMVEATFDGQDGRPESARLRALLAGYETVIDLERGGKPASLAAFEATATQHELLIY